MEWGESPTLKNMIGKIEANGKTYEIKIVYRRYPDDDEQFLLALKEKNRCDALIKNNTHYFICNEISEASFIELPNDNIKEIVTETTQSIEN